MKKTAFTSLLIFSVAFSNAQPNGAGNIIFTNVLSNNNGPGNNISQTRNTLNQTNAHVAPILVNFFIPDSQQRTIPQVNRNTSNTNRNTEANITQTAPAQRRTTTRTNRTNEQNRMRNISPIFVLISDNNVGNFIIIQNNDVQQSAEENIQRKIALPEISIPNWEINKQVKPVKTKAVSSSKSKHTSSRSKKHNKKTNAKIARWFKDNGIKNVKPNYELCFKF